MLASKWLWRQGYIRCPETCSDDTPMSDCVCSCPSELTDRFSSSKEVQTKLASTSPPPAHFICYRRQHNLLLAHNSVDTIYYSYTNVHKQFLNATGLMALSDGLFEDWTNFITTGCFPESDCYDVVVKSLCHVGHAGEMFTSAAPYDPIFWPIHGLADRQTYSSMRIRIPHSLKCDD